MKVYTSKGDGGFTTDFSGQRLLKDDIRILVNGKIDNLQSALDMSIFLCKNDEDKKVLNEVQKKMWQVAGEVANCDKECLIWPVTDNDLLELEKFIDSLGEPPKKFVRFENEKAIWFNECRVRCRELETLIVKLLRDGTLRGDVFKYVNRLSSLFFMMGYKASDD
ncbi:MAG: ATP:cob(I)alamin adenosyltransferase [Nanoarchaeota archaeon]